MRLNRYIPMAMMGAAALLTGCSEEELGREGGVGGPMPLTVKVSRTAQPDSRTVLTETTAGLSDEWEGTETLLAFDQAGTKVGELAFVEYGKDKTEAVFQGTIDGVADGQYQYRLWYLGATVNGAAPYSEIKNDYKVDGINPDLVKVMHSAQSGKFADLMRGDLMSVPVSLTVQNHTTYAETTVTMADCLAMARFHINGADGVTDGTLAIAYESGNIPYRYYFSPSGAECVAATAATMTPLTVSGVNTSEDVYVVLPPTFSGRTAEKLVFTLTSGEDTWTYTTATAPTIEAGVYYCNTTDAGAVNGGFVLDMVKEGGDEPEDPNNPGNTGNWGVSANLMPEYTKLYSKPKFEQLADGWTVNTDIYGSGGFGPYIRYDHNGIAKAGLLFSDGNGEAYYYQWGRWFGFPPTVYNAEVYHRGSWIKLGNPLTALPGVSLYNDGSITGYIWDNYQWGFFYQSCAFDGLLDKTKADHFALVWSIITSTSSTMDYMSGNADCTWEERSGNPCPNGYRLPKPEELAIFIPEKVTTISSSHAEVKTVNGEKFAMKWVVNTSATPTRLEICSVKTNKTTVSTTDAIFDNAPVIYLHAMGYMDGTAVLRGKGSIGAYWSNASGVLTDKDANGGKYLKISFSGSSATLSLETAYRCMGQCVLPIKDENAKTVSITPWFPVAETKY